MLTFLLWVERSRCGALGGEQMHSGVETESSNRASGQSRLDFLERIMVDISVDFTSPSCAICSRVRCGLPAISACDVNGA